MKYMSSRAPVEKDIPADTLEEVQAYVKKTFPNGVDKNTFGEVHDALFAFRKKDGKKLLINQLAPIYLAICWAHPIV